MKVNSYLLVILIRCITEVFFFFFLLQNNVNLLFTMKNIVSAVREESSQLVEACSRIGRGIKF